MNHPFKKILLAVLLAVSVSGLLAAPPLNPPPRERQVTILRKEVLAQLIADAERLEKIEAADLKEDRSKRQELADGSYVLFLEVHDLKYKFKMSPEGKVISFGKSFEWWEIALAAALLIGAGFAAGAATSK